MNSIFDFFIPRIEVAYINTDDTLRQAMEKMEYHRYTAVPIVDTEDCFAGVLTEGDILWYIKKQGLGILKDAERINIMDIPRRSNVRCIGVAEPILSVIDLSLNQNFVPLSDDRGKFIGIITRKKIIDFLSKYYREKAGL